MRFWEFLNYYPNENNKIKIHEKIISYKGPNEAPDLMNPSQKEFEAACSRAKYGDMRGVLLGDGNLYLADAENNNHTDLIDRLGLEEDENSIRIIARSPSKEYPKGYITVEDWARSENEPIPNPAKLISIVKKAPAIIRIMRSGANIEAICWDHEWNNNQEMNGTF